MNKKIIFYFLTALIVLIFKTELSYSIPTISEHNVDNVNGKSGFRKRSNRNTTDSFKSDSTKSVPPFMRKYSINNNTISEAILNRRQNQNIPIGILLIHNAAGELFHCTASVINTPDNGNIAITAAHCLYDFQNHRQYQNILFSPGFDNEQAGRLGLINVAQIAVPNEFENNNDNHFDYGMVRLDFNRDGHPLQYFTGALGYRFDVGDNVHAAIRGYPDGGELPNCPNDGLHLCLWQGIGNRAADFFTVHDLELGEGASGAPMMVLYDPGTNLGWVYSDYASFDDIEEDGLGPIFDPIVFHALIGELILH